jgi:hypothetical protein
MEANKFLFRAAQGKRTALDIAYTKHITNIIETLDEEQEERWETYNIIIEALIEDGKGNYFKEIKYRLTDGENPNEVILDIIERQNDDISGLIWYLKKRVEEYAEIDYLKRFYE